MAPAVKTRADWLYTFSDSVGATTGKTRGHQVPKRPNTPYKTKQKTLQRVGSGMDSVLKSSSGGHSKMSPNLNARGLGLGETPLRRWGGYRGSVIVSVARWSSSVRPKTMVDFSR
eukprot:scaffold18103_cov90-Phaeocystis_antarctica.AAC.1